MVRRFAVFAAVLGMSIGTAEAQEVNARAALQASLKAMGGENLKTIQYSGAGWSSLIGQTYGLDMLMAYLPKEKILLNADLYSPPAQGTQLPAAPTPGQKTLYQNILKLKLDVARHVPVHGRVGTNEEFLRMFGTAARTN